MALHNEPIWAIKHRTAGTISHDPVTSVPRLFATHKAAVLYRRQMWTRGYLRGALRIIKVKVVEG
jgi:hypothetical protein